MGTRAEIKAYFQTGDIPTEAQFAEWANQTILDNQVILSADLPIPATLTAGIEYLVDGIVDLGTTSLVLPTGSVNITGLGFGVSKLISSEDTYTMFTYDGVNSGDLFLRGLEIEVTGTGSKVFNLNNDTNEGGVELREVNFNLCTSLGSLEKYRQFFGENVGFFNNIDGIELVGAWAGGFRLSTAIARGNSGTIVKAGTGLVLANRFLTDINCEGETNLTFTDLAPVNITNDEDFEILGADFNGVLSAIPNFPASSPKAKITNSSGIDNTYVGGEWVCTTEATTTIATVEVPVKLAGTTTYADMQWFTQTTNNAFVSDTSECIEISIVGTVSLSGGNNDQVQLLIRRWDEDTSQMITEATSPEITLNSGGRAENVTIIGNAKIGTKLDRIEIWGQNNTDTSNMIMLLNSKIDIKER